MQNNAGVWAYALLHVIANTTLQEHDGTSAGVAAGSDDDHADELRRVADGHWFGASPRRRVVSIDTSGDGDPLYELAVYVRDVRVLYFAL